MWVMPKIFGISVCNWNLRHKAPCTIIFAGGIHVYTEQCKATWCDNYGILFS